jgi:hypothetical protein
MKGNSRPKAALAVLLAISLLATGCTAQWISVALADLPVLLQMALNIGSLVTTLQSGQQLSASEAQAIQNISAEASKDLNLLQTQPAANALQPVSSQSGRQCAAENSEHGRGHQPELAGIVAGRTHCRSSALSPRGSRGEPDSGHCDQLCGIDSASLRDADRPHGSGSSNRKASNDSPSSGPQEAVESGGVRSHRESQPGCRIFSLSAEIAAG